MELAALQRELRSLIKGRETTAASTDLYLRAVAGSTHLQVVREIALYWLAYSVDSTSPLTCAALRRRDAFDAAIEAFVGGDVPPFVEELATSFLEAQSSHPDPLVASVARFEGALRKVKRGDTGRYVVRWEYEPYGALAALLSDEPIPEPENVPYQTVVSANIPELFTVEHLG